MADFRQLTEEIVSVIKQNDNREITGQVLQDILLAILEAVNTEKQDTLTEGSITSEYLEDGAVISIKIADEAVNLDKLAQEVKDAFATAFDVEGPLAFKDEGGENVLYINLSNYFTKDEINAALETLTLAIANEKRLRENGDTALSENIEGHKARRDNPHVVTKAQIGLGNVDNTSDENKPVSADQRAAINTEKERAQGVEAGLSGRLDAIEEIVPEQASDENLLADRAFVNSSIQTSTATFRGTVYATEDTEEAAQEALSTITDMDNNDYANVVVENYPTQGIDKYERYTYNGLAWVFNYALNTSGFTAAQIAAINSGATAEAIAQMARKDRANVFTKSQTVNGEDGSVVIEGGEETAPAVSVKENNVETKYKSGKISHNGNTVNLPATAGTLAITGDVLQALAEAKDYTDDEVADGVAEAKGYTDAVVGDIALILDDINGEEI